MEDNRHCIDDDPNSDHLKAARASNDGISDNVEHHCCLSAPSLRTQSMDSQTKRNAYALEVTSDTFAMIGLPTATTNMQPARLSRIGDEDGCGAVSDAMTIPPDMAHQQCLAKLEQRR